MDRRGQAAQLIKTEIQTGRTFAQVALSSNDPTKKARNAANARKAYDTARAWAEMTALTLPDKIEITGQLEHLKAELARLEQRGRRNTE